MFKVIIAVLLLVCGAYGEMFNSNDVVEDLLKDASMSEDMREVDEDILEDILQQRDVTMDDITDVWDDPMQKDRKISSRITCEYTTGKTTWGEWSNRVMCNKTVSGFRLQVEEKQSFFRDDTALNGIQLLCDDGRPAKQINGPYGEWQSWKQCKKGEHVVGLELRSEADQGVGRDDTAGNNIRMKCSDKREIDGGGLDWGSWDGWKVCPTRSAMCGVEARIESETRKDATGLNQIKLICCLLPDIDECSTSNGGCDKNAICKNTVGSHTCHCHTGFKGDGKKCTGCDASSFTLLGTHKKCSLKNLYTFKQNNGKQVCDGWNGITLSECQQKCVRNKSPPGCPPKQCKYLMWFPSTKWCHLASDQCTIVNSPTEAVSLYKMTCAISPPQATLTPPPPPPQPTPPSQHSCEGNKKMKGIGCYNDHKGWKYVLNGRYVVDWKNYARFLRNFVCQCRKKAVEHNKQYFSIRFWAECWVGDFNPTTIPSETCKDEKYQNCEKHRPEYCSGVSNTEYVYKRE